jgi:hypothetical protein
LSLLDRLARNLDRVLVLARRGAGPIAIITVFSLAIALVVGLPETPPTWMSGDGRTYWEAMRANDPYESARLGEVGAYLYSPAFRLVLAPILLLPWPVFAFVLAAAGGVAARVLGSRAAGARPWLWVPIGIVAALDILVGNINLLLAAAIVAGFRWPAAWSFVVLTKVTPGIGVLWFAVRREWRQLGIALAATLLIIGLSGTLSLDGWIDWMAVLLNNTHVGALNGDIAIPAVVRFPIALLLIAWGARRNQRWVVPIACVLLLPAVWPAGLAILVGCAALSGRETEARENPPTSRRIRAALKARHSGAGWGFSPRRESAASTIGAPALPCEDRGGSSPHSSR